MGNRFGREQRKKLQLVLKNIKKITKSIKSLKNELERNGKTVKILQRNRKYGVLAGICCGILLKFAVIILDGISLCVLICIRVSAPVCRCTTIIIPDAIRY